MPKKKKNVTWDKERKKIINQYFVLTREEVLTEHGEEELISHLQEKLGKSRKEIKGLLKKL